MTSPTRHFEIDQYGTCRADAGFELDSANDPDFARLVRQSTGLDGSVIKIFERADGQLARQVTPKIGRPWWESYVQAVYQPKESP